MFAGIKTYKMMMNSSVWALRAVITHLSAVVLTTGKKLLYLMPGKLYFIPSCLSEYLKVLAAPLMEPSLFLSGFSWIR